MFTGDLIDGERAAAMDLVKEAGPGDELDDRVELIVERLQNRPTANIGLAKEAIHDNLGPTLVGRSSMRGPPPVCVLRHARTRGGHRRIPEWATTGLRVSHPAEWVRLQVEEILGILKENLPLHLLVEIGVPCERLQPRLGLYHRIVGPEHYFIL